MGRRRQAGLAETWARHLRLLEHATGVLVVDSGDVWRVGAGEVPSEFLAGGMWNAPPSARRVDDDDLRLLNSAINSLTRARSLSDLIDEGAMPLRRWREADLTAILERSVSHARLVEWALAHAHDPLDFDSDRPIGVLCATATVSAHSRPSIEALQCGAMQWPRGMEPRRILDACAEAGLDLPPFPGPFAFNGLPAQVVAADRLLDVAGPGVARRWLVSASRSWPSPEVRGLILRMAMVARTVPDTRVLTEVAACRRAFASDDSAESAALRSAVDAAVRDDETNLVLVPMVATGNLRVAGWLPSRLFDHLKDDAAVGSFARNRLDRLLDFWEVPRKVCMPGVEVFRAVPDLPIGLCTRWERWIDTLLIGADRQWRRRVWPGLVQGLARGGWSVDWDSGGFGHPGWVLGLPADLALGVLACWPVHQPSGGWKERQLRRYLRALEMIGAPDSSYDHWSRARWFAELASGPHHQSVFLLLNAGTRDQWPLSSLEALLASVAKLDFVARTGVGSDAENHRLKAVRDLLEQWSTPTVHAEVDEVAGWSTVLDIPADDLVRYLHYRRIAGDGEELPRSARRLLTADPVRQIEHLNRRLRDTELDHPKRRALEEERGRLEDPVVREARSRRARVAIANQIRTATVDYHRRALPHLLTAAVERVLGALPSSVSLDYLIEALVLATDSNVDLVLLRRFFALVADRDDVNEWPENQAWRSRVFGRFDVGAWLDGFDEAFVIDGERYLCRTERQPLIALRMGSWFNTCLSLGGMHGASALTNVIEANRHVVYLLDVHGRVVARKLIGVTDEGHVIGFHTYAYRPGEEVTAAINKAIEEFSLRCGTSLASGGRLASLTGACCYDDGAEDWNGTRSADPARYEEVRNPDASPSELAHHSRDVEAYVRAAAAANPHTSTETLSQLARDEVSSVRRAVAQNPTVHPSMLSELAKDGDPQVRSDIADSPSAPSVTLTQLARDKEPQVRRRAAANPYLDPGVLSELAGDDDAVVCSAVLANPNAPTSVLEWAAKRVASMTQEYVMSNPHVPTPILRLAGPREAHDDASLIAQHVNSSTEALDALTDHHSPWVRELVAKHDRASPWALTTLANDDENAVRLAVVKRLDAPRPALVGLSRDANPTIRALVARHPNSPAEAMAELGDDHSSKVRRDVAGHPATRSDTLDRLALDDFVSVRRLVGAHCNTSADALTLLAGDQDTRVCREVAMNPATPGNALVRLLRENFHDARVREWAFLLGWVNSVGGRTSSADRR